jgi:SNF2 family DNA or RNA helicase
MTAQQKKMYKDMAHKLYAEALEGGITAANEAVKLMKLVQVVTGVVYRDDGGIEEIDCKPRVQLLKEIVEETEEKVIVFVPLTGVLRMLETELSKHWTVGVVNGETSVAKRNQIFADFQNGKNPRILLAHPKTMSHGLTLTEASTIIWYGPVTSNEVYEQACARITRIGQKYKANIIHIESTDTEKSIYQRLRSKQRIQGILLSLVEGQD